jgi:hypothetical protein
MAPASGAAARKWLEVAARGGQVEALIMLARFTTKQSILAIPEKQSNGSLSRLISATQQRSSIRDLLFQGDGVEGSSDG